MREAERPSAKFAGFTDVDDLADAIARPVADPGHRKLNGRRQWLTVTDRDRHRAPTRVRHHDPEARGFASDNYAGVHPEVLAALAAANGGHQVAYGEDVYTARLQEVFREPLRRAAPRRSRSSTAPAPTSSRCRR